MPVPIHPLEVITSTNQSGLIVVITTLTLSFALACVFIRFYFRIFSNGPWKRDDGTLAAVAFFACAQSAVVFFQVTKGLGRTKTKLSSDDITQIGKGAYASDVLYIFAFFLSKSSTALLFLRLQPGHLLSVVSWGTIAGSAVWALASILMISIRCSPAHPWVDLAAQCGGLFVRWQIIGAFDVAIEAALFLTSIGLVTSLQMPLRLKAMVVLAFSLRLPAIAACGVRLHYLQITINAADPTLKGAFSTIWTQIELNYSILASAISCLGPFISPFVRETNDTYADTRQRSTANNNTGNNYGLKSFSSRRHDDKDDVVSKSEQSRASKRKFETPVVEPPLFRPDQQLHHKATITHNTTTNSNRQRSFESSESRRMIIRKEVEWSVERDDSSLGGGEEKQDQTMERRSNDAATAPATAKTHEL